MTRINSPPFLTAQWRDLAMLNFVVDPGLLAGLVPPGTELDFFAERTYVSIVGFRFVDTRVRGLSAPCHRDFDEVNLRFYVRERAEEGWRRGVVFIREIAPRRLVVWLARKVYNENYIYLPMRSSVERTTLANGAGSVTLRYDWLHKGRWQGLSATAVGEFHLPDSGSEEEFIAEHYWGYTIQRDGGTLSYEVNHPPWRVCKASAVQFDCDAEQLYGTAFAEVLSRPPASAFLAEGSEIVVRKGRRVAYS